LTLCDGAGDYSTRQQGTTTSLIIWVEVYVASVTFACFSE